MRQGLKYKRHHAFVIVRLNKRLKLKLSIDITKIVVKSYLFVIKKEFFDKVYGTIISSRRSEIKKLVNMDVQCIFHGFKATIQK